MEVHYWQDANQSGTKALNESVRGHTIKRAGMVQVQVQVQVPVFQIKCT